MKDHAWKVIEERKLGGKVDRVRVEQVIKEKSGIAENVTARPKEAEVAKEKVFFQKFFDFFKPGSAKKGKTPRPQGTAFLGGWAQNGASRVNLRISSV